ncbi:Uma2 family endonuclease [Leptolyngbya sp. FACHB-321]|uniref:Uma2 family endonuclease n=1 Tax=Leptolyngbya sp. FACHB-321 TaxID=2692807 RepID=UPI0016826453|nr:Uma2 family endonuclease [Leptolyngbya sp. FACHB-321]
MTLTKVRLWTVDEYHHMTAVGILAPEEQVELIEGQIIPMAAKNPPHAATNLCAADHFRQALIGQALVRIQDPIRLGEYSEPEPDIAIVRLDSRKYIDHHPAPTEIFLLIEVADTTLAFDRGQKANLYAKAGIADYWILDVNDRQVYVLRAPTPEGYQQETVFGSDAVLAPLAFPGVDVSLQQLFP